VQIELVFRLRLCGFHYACVGGGLEQSQSGFSQVAFVGDLPFVVGFDEHGAGQS
jgi:hypothetical protein